MPQGYSGFGKLGEMLVGGDSASQEAMQIKTMDALARRDANMARAQVAIDKARMRPELGNAYADIQSDDPVLQARGVATIQRGGFNPQQGTGALGNLQEQRFRQAAVDAPTMGDANRQLMGVARGPVALAAVQGDTLLGNRFVEGGMLMGPTAVGQSRIDANEATARARDSAGALSTARTQWGPTGRRADGGIAAPKLSEVDKLRMRAELSGIESQLKELRTQHAAMNGGDPRLEAARGDIEKSIADLEKAQMAVFDKYDQNKRGGLGDIIGSDAEAAGRAVAEAEGIEYTPDLGRNIAAQMDAKQGEFSIPVGGIGDQLAGGKAPAAPPKTTKIKWTQPAAQAQLDRARKAVAAGKVTKEEAARRLRDAGLVNAAGRL